MSQTRKSNTGKSSSGRTIKDTQFETVPETVAERFLQEENRDTKLLFYYSQALFSCYLNADNWPAKTTTDFKLSLKAGQRTDMWHRFKPQNSIFLGKGPSKLVSVHQKQTLDRLKRGLPATHVPTQVQKSAAALPSNTADGARETATATQCSENRRLRSHVELYCLTIHQLVSATNLSRLQRKRNLGHSAVKCATISKSFWWGTSRDWSALEQLLTYSKTTQTKGDARLRRRWKN